jgi:hypothetical protein
MELGAEPLPGVSAFILHPSAFEEVRGALADDFFGDRQG